MSSTTAQKTYDALVFPGDSVFLRCSLIHDFLELIGFRILTAPRERKRERERERERERDCVCVYVFVCVSGRERERDKAGNDTR